MPKFLAALCLLLSTPLFAAFFADEVVIQKDQGTCDKSKQTFAIVLETALRAPISQITSRALYDGACLISFTYYANEKILIETGGWQHGIIGDLCGEYKKIAERRFLDTTTIPLLSSACNGAIFQYSYVNHRHHVPALREEAFLVNSDSRQVDRSKAKSLLAYAGAEKIEYFSSGENYGYAYRLDTKLKRIRWDWDEGAMPFIDAGYVFTEESKAKQACKIESDIASKLTSEMTEIGSHYECSYRKDPNYVSAVYRVGMSPWQLKGGKLPKENKRIAKLWEDWVPLPGYSNDLLYCQQHRQLAMENYARFTGKKPSYALCVERDRALHYWMVGK